MLAMTDLDLQNKRLLIREDFNVPLNQGGILDDERISRAIPTIRFAIEKGAKVLLCSHLGRPKEGVYEDKYSLKPVSERLSELLNVPVELKKDWLDGVALSSGQVVLAENVRFNKGELENSPTLSQQMAKLCDIFVMDAFATAHRKQASTYGIAEYAPIACAGPLLLAEITALDNVIKSPRRPLCAIVGGSKVSTKIAILESLLDQVNQLIVGGGIANTFLAAMGYEVGKSLYEKDWLDASRQLINKAERLGVQLPIPKDVVVAKEFSATAKAHLKSIADVDKDDIILDVGPLTNEEYGVVIKQAATILWNGPLGVFEFPAFANGTWELTKDITSSHAFSVAGGGDTLAALEIFNAKDGVSYITTGGGAFLEYVEKGSLPVLDILKKRSDHAAR